jgi:hypothetical protein
MEMNNKIFTITAVAEHRSEYKNVLKIMTLSIPYAQLEQH